MHYITYIRCIILVIKGYRDLQASHFMLPDEPLLDLATHDEYKYRQTFPGNSRSFRVGKTVKNLGLKNVTIKKDLVQNKEEISQCYGHQSAVYAPIQVFDLYYWFPYKSILIFVK